MFLDSLILRAVWHRNFESMIFTINSIPSSVACSQESAKNRKKAKESSSKMVNTRKSQKTPENDPKSDAPSEKNEMLEQLKLVVSAETEKMENSNKRKFDAITEKLQSMEESIAKIPKFDDNRCNEKLVSGKSFVLKSVFKDVASFQDGGRLRSETEEHFNVKWYIKIVRKKRHLRVFVHCNPIAHVGDGFSIETKSEIKLIGRNNRVVSKTLEGCLRVEILKTTGLEREKLRLFDESQKEVSDIILVVKDVKFYVSKMVRFFFHEYLAAQSSFFKTLFFGNFSESNKSEIALSEIDPNDFQCFLEALYGESAIDDSTVEAILHVADMYNTSTVIRKCEEFLLEKSEKDLKKKLKFSTQYRLEKLKVDID
ncbi:hypothetical protein B9Z55_004970 [Caenorhabditis nigoni]|uniref:BTB domain-containing protein n=2 Tax=Caenorhabditis nigoni TaxID=1611254 RepID=A0A2G5UYS1_9PELO|nr:hypothetical protein B9Z55_004970 [Caenorhabditis nigoni]